jgi:hypothetical protein
MRPPAFPVKSTAMIVATLCLLGSRAAGGAIQVVNMIPRSMSGETERDSEPNVAVNPANPLLIAASAFTPDPLKSGSGPIFVSQDGGATWSLNVVLPGGDVTKDVTLRFADTSNILYAGILRKDGHMNLLRKTNFLAPGLMTVLLDRPDEDQPYTQAATFKRGNGARKDRAYFGFNSLKHSVNGTAKIEQSLDIASAQPPAGLVTRLIETRPTCNANGSSIRPAIHPDGRIYAAFFGWRECRGGSFDTVSDVVVVRDDDWGSGAYQDLKEGLVPGVRVATSVAIFPLNAPRSRLGAQRAGSHISIAADPRRHSKTVYLAWADGVTPAAYTLHLRRSDDGGSTWTKNDLRTIVQALNPALAVNSRGRVGFLYQKLVGNPPNQRWETHFERSDDGSRPTDVVLASVLDIEDRSHNPIGDYNHLMSVGEDFYGAFSGSNTPDRANFPSGIVYLRNADWTGHKLRDLDNNEVPVSIDPFFFRVTGTAPAPLQSGDPP